MLATVGILTATAEAAAVESGAALNLQLPVEIIGVESGQFVDPFQNVWRDCPVPQGFFTFRMPWFCDTENAAAEMHLPVPEQSAELSYPIRGHVFLDVDFSDIVCDFPGVIDWPELRRHARHLAKATTMEEIGAACKAGKSLDPGFRVGAQQDPGAKFVFPTLTGILSDASSDCFLGTVTYIVMGFICMYTVSSGGVDGADDRNTVRAWWLALCLQLEGLIFYLEVPFLSIAASPWPIFELLGLVGMLLRSTSSAEAFAGSRCDTRRSAETDAFLVSLYEFLDSANFKLYERAARLAHHLLSMQEESTIFHHCHFSIIAAAVLLEAGNLGSGRLSLAHQMLRAYEQQSPKYFFRDLLVTDWPLWRLFQDVLQVDLQKWQRASMAAGIDGMQDLLISEGHPQPPQWPQQPLLDPCHDEGSSLADSLPPVNFTWPWNYSREHLHRAVCNLRSREVLFMSTWQGSELQHSYAMRARQMARSLRRVLGLEAKTCLVSCKKCCVRLAVCLLQRNPSCSVPAVVVHIKGLCDCAVHAFPRTVGVVHILDPIDTWVQAPPLFKATAGILNTSREISALLAETSLSAYEYANHPSIRALAWKVFHLPHHHTNFARRAIQCREKVQTVGVHSTQLDPELQEGIERLLADRFPGVAFQHIDPTLRFEGSGRKASPTPWSFHASEQMVRDLLSFDVSLAKPNCYEPVPEEQTEVHFRVRAWLCERHQGGQRLVHALAAGLPTVVWGASQGFLDAVSPSPDWPLALSNDEMLLQLARILENRTLRCMLSQEAQILAEPYHVSRTVERYAILFEHLLRGLHQELNLGRWPPDEHRDWLVNRWVSVVAAGGS